ncbi:GGDEF domain-containing protein [Thermus caliditerrae]|uniref:GGDEF domain-containing protein n=1 Tax=Thermus caliditerrae TaxID=1330700 RepID=A0A7C5RDU8_9DEIN|nr:GGDEF domain-containing protein [Thermus caliditerrae]
MDRLARVLYGVAWVGLPLGIAVQLWIFPPGPWAWVYGVFALVFLMALLKGPREAPRYLTHAVGAYLLFELWHSEADWVGVGFFVPAVYLLAAFAYRLPWALAFGFLWGAALVAAPWALGRETGLEWAHFVLAQPVLLALTLLLARFRELHGQARFWREQALTDPLTGLPNRRALEMALEKEAARVERGEKPFSLILLDLDDFKRVNDEKGHPEGDRLLQEVARHLVAHVRRGDLVARFGGEEFAILLPATDCLRAERLAERLKEGLAARGVTASFGVALYQGSLEALLQKADQALYRAKGLGKNRVVRDTEGCGLQGTR